MNARILLAGHENKDADKKFVNYFKDSVKLCRVGNNRREAWGAKIGDTANIFNNNFNVE